MPYTPGEVAKSTFKDMMFKKLTGYRRPGDPNASRPGPQLTDRTNTIPADIMSKINDLTVDQREMLLGKLK